MRTPRTLAFVSLLVLAAMPVTAQSMAQQGLAQRSVQPPQSVLLRFQLIEADGYTESDPAIADVIGVLRELFRFRGYRLSSESVVRVTAGADFRQEVTGVDGSSYAIQGHTHMIDSHAGGQTITLSVELWRQPGNQLIKTSLSVPVGQTVVVGSARSSPEHPTVILVVRPEAR